MVCAETGLQVVVHLLQSRPSRNAGGGGAERKSENVTLQDAEVGLSGSGVAECSAAGGIPEVAGRWCVCTQNGNPLPMVGLPVGK